MARTINQKGFTLIELIIVVTIIGLIALVATPSFSKLKTSANVHEDLNTIASFIKTSRIWAFTHKQEVRVELSESGKKISAIWTDAPLGTDNNIQKPAELKEEFGRDGFIEADKTTSTSYLTINSRGIIDVKTPDANSLFNDNSFYLKQNKQNKHYDGQNCLAIDKAGVFLGVYDYTDDGKCDAKKDFKE